MPEVAYQVLNFTLHHFPRLSNLPLTASLRITNNTYFYSLYLVIPQPYIVVKNNNLCPGFQHSHPHLPTADRKKSQPAT